MSFCACWQLRRRKKPNDIEESGRNGQQIQDDGGQRSTASSTSPPRHEEDQQPTTSSAATTGNARVLPIFSSFLKRRAVKSVDVTDGGNKTAQPTAIGSRKPPPPIPSAKVPSKKVSFSWNLSSQQQHDSYEYIDDDEDGTEKKDGTKDETEDGYSKLDETQSQHRYDYPSFMVRRQRRSTTTAAADEQPYYASASQTYSMGSEDPYSSIVSVAGGGDRPSAAGDDESSGIYEPGYSRIKNKLSWPMLDGRRTKGPSTGKAARDEQRSELDALYAKINRRPSMPKSSLDPSNHRHHRSQQPPQPSTSSTAAHSSASSPVKMDNGRRGTGGGGGMLTVKGGGAHHQQEGESGSGSVTSGSQPSYRYLTVRESPRTIRERIRRREETAGDGLGNGGDGGENGRRTAEGGEGSGTGTRMEHYYSEITEYESVGGESIYGGLPATNSSTAGEQPAAVAIEGGDGGDHRPLSLNDALSMDSTLRVLLSPIPGGGGDPPRPPTSPIPKSQPAVTAPPPPPLPPTIRRPIVVMRGAGMPTPSSFPPAGPSAKNQSSSSATTTYTSSNSNGAHRRSPTKDFQRHMRSVLQPLWHHNGAMLTDGSDGRREEEAEEAEKGPINGSGFPSANGCYSSSRGIAEVETQTPPVPPSRIPVPVSARPWTTSVLRRTPSPTQDVAVQTAAGANRVGGRGGGGWGEEGGPTKKQQHHQQHYVKPGAPQLPAQVGKDYVSPIDLGHRRAWPLTLVTSLSPSLEEE